MLRVIIGMISPEEVLLELQQDALIMHEMEVFAINNNISNDVGDQCRAIQNYSGTLGSIEEQINQLFV